MNHKTFSCLCVSLFWFLQFGGCLHHSMNDIVQHKQRLDTNREVLHLFHETVPSLFGSNSYFLHMFLYCGRVTREKLNWKLLSRWNGSRKMIWLQKVLRGRTKDVLLYASYLTKLSVTQTHLWFQSINLINLNEDKLYGKKCENWHRQNYHTISYSSRVMLLWPH